ncbi:MAG: hypothetical protein AAGG09_13610 [Pseudomonadota bacterium]
MVLFSAASADAGAWEREEGTGFASFSYNLPTDSEEAQEGTVSAYFEYGLPWRLTAGANLDQRPIGPHALEVFLRRNVNAPDAELQVAIEVGFEIALDAHMDETTGAIRYTADPGQPTLALHIGRGFASQLGYGWVDARLGLNFPTDDIEYSGEIDATIGLSVSERAFMTFEVWHDFTRERSVTSLVPGAGYRLTDRFALTAKYIYDADDVASDSVEIGAWIEF